jgi:hypothetical protein
VPTPDEYESPKAAYSTAVAADAGITTDTVMAAAKATAPAIICVRRMKVLHGPQGDDGLMDTKG